MNPYVSPPVMLSSVEKIAYYIGVDAGQGWVSGINSDTQDQRDVRRSIIQWATALSTSFQQYCSRNFLIQQYEQYFDVAYDRQEYFVAGVPMQAVILLENDPLGLFQGGQWIAQNNMYHFSQGGYSLQMITNLLMPGPNAMHLVYLGGLAVDPVNTTFTISAPTGTPAPGMYVLGLTSFAQGQVVSYAVIDGIYTLVIANIFGIFRATETFQFMSSLYGQAITGISATGTGILFQSLCEAFPDLDLAVSIEARYNLKHLSDFENQTDGGRYGSERRKLDNNSAIVTFQPETCAILDRYRRILGST